MDHKQRAEQVIDTVKSALAPIWLGNRQRMLLTQAIAAALRDVEAAAVKATWEKAAQSIAPAWFSSHVSGADQGALCYPVREDILNSASHYVRVG